MDTRFIAVMNQKGGVGKTTLTANLGAALATRGKKVLLLDLDPQANLSIHLNVNIHKLEKSIYNVLIGAMEIEETVVDHVQPNLFLVPATIDLSGAEVELVNAVGRETLLRDSLSIYVKEHPCDFVILDCPPSLGILSLNALCAAQEVFIPIQTEFFALQGLAKLIGVIDLIRKRLNGLLHLSRVVPTLFDTRTSLSKEVLTDIKNHFGNIVTNTIIRKNVRLAEAPSYGKTIFEYAPNSTGSKDFSSLGDEILSTAKKVKIPKEKKTAGKEKKPLEKDIIQQKARSKAKSKAKAKAEVESDAKAKSKVESDAEAKSKSKAEAKAEAKSKSKAKSEVDTEAKVEAGEIALIEEKAAQAVEQLCSDLKQRFKPKTRFNNKHANGFRRSSRNSIKRMMRVRFKRHVLF